MGVEISKKLLTGKLFFFLKSYTTHTCPNLMFIQGPSVAKQIYRGSVV